MRNNVNDKFLATRARWAKTLSFAGLGCLVASVALMNRMAVLSWGILLMGLIVSSSGSYLAARYVREPTAQGALGKALKGFDDHHLLYNFVLPVEHAFVTPSGVWVILVKKQPGQFSYDGKKWRQKFTLARLLSFLGEPGLRNPIRDIGRDIALVSEKLAQGLPDTEVPIDGVVVFTDPRTSVQVKHTSRPVISLENLKSFFRRALKENPPLPPKIQRQLVRVFDEWAS